MERKINEGQAYANSIIPRAIGEKARILEEAEGYRRSIIAQAEGDTQRFKQLALEYEQAPEITRRRLYLETLESVLARSNKIIIDQESGGNNLIYLPLDRLIQSGRDGGYRDSDATVEKGAVETEAGQIGSRIRSQLEEQAKNLLNRNNR